MKRVGDAVLVALAAAVAVAALLRRSEPVAQQAPASRIADPHPPARPATDRTTSTLAGEATTKPEVVGIVKELMAAVKRHRLVMLGAALAYYGFFMIFPVTLAAVSLYGLLGDPSDIERFFDQSAGMLPEVTAEFLENQLRSLFEAPSTGLGIATVVALVATLWSASAGVKALMVGIDAVHDDVTDEGFLKVRMRAMGTTLVLLVTALASATVLAALPPILDTLGFGADATQIVRLVRWPGAAALVLGGLTFLYRSAPGSTFRRDGWLSRGAVAATAAMAVVTIGFGLVVSYGNFAEVYGALTGLAVLMLWFFTVGVIVLVGAELDRIVNERRSAPVGGHRVARPGD